jgi:Sulfotransferase domain
VSPLRLPDFLIGGAPRSGTTWLYALLDRHPDVYMAKPVTPEPKFFLVDDLYRRGLRFYSERWFAEAPAGAQAGEKSTDYLESAAAAERIAGDLPAIKLIFILREPGARAYSNYLWTKMNGLEVEDFETALRLEDERERTLPEKWRFARPFSYFSRGLYSDLLEPYIRRVPRDRLLVLKFEDLVDRPTTVASRLQRFVGVADRPEDARALDAINPSVKGSARPSAKTMDALSHRYEEPNRRLAAMLGPEFEPWR